MNSIRFFFFISLLAICSRLSAQNNTADSLKNLIAKSSGDSNQVNQMNQLARLLYTSQPDESLRLANEAKSLSIKLGYKKGEALALKTIGLYYFIRSQYLEATNFWQQSLDVYTAINDEVGISNMYNNLGSAQYNTANYARALEFYLKAVELAEKTGDKLRMATAYNNVGLCYMNKPATYDQAFSYFRKGLEVAKQIDDKANIGSAYVNMGEIYMNMGVDSLALVNYLAARAAYEPNEDNLPYALNNIGKFYQKKKEFSKALEFHELALSKSNEKSSQLFVAQSNLEIAEVFRLLKKNTLALNYFKRANEIAKEIQSNIELKRSYDGLASTYNQLMDYRNAYNNQLKSTLLSDSLYKFTTEDIRLNYEVGLKQKEVDLLTYNNKLRDEEIKRQKLVRNALLVGFGLVSALIFILYRDYRNKIRTNKLLDQRKAEIESLLLNILPFEVAVELQNTGQATPRFYENVSVLFTDFVSFSKIAETLSPQQVVEELNEFFIAMDNIIEKYQLEKIKTIGDSYMCAGGIPTVNQTHPIAIVKAGLEILEYLNIKNTIREKNGLNKWELRIGVHTGPLVAGVVGKKKYAYDIWGSTVNIASRMESNGQPGLLNISSALYEQIKDRFDCTYRGKIYAKNVGEIDMYFVNKELISDAVSSKEAVIAEN
jgi:class 3 adenylate cyclase/uncharacterized protein HemY